MDLTDKTILITGATSGIGKETATVLAKMGARVVFTSRDLGKGLLIKEEMIKQSKNNKIDVFQCDLSSFASIKEFCNKFNSKYKRLDVLINNAGVWETKYVPSKDGIENNFATNHLAPFLLTNLLLGILKKSAPSRIINVSSELHRKSSMQFEDLESKKSFNYMKSYGQSKLANILFTKQLAQNLKNTGVTANSLMPGVVASTRLFRNASIMFKIIISFLSVPLEEGAQTSIYLASSPEVEGITGEYFEKKKIKQTSQESYDLNVANRLWEISENYIREYLDS